MRRNFKIKINWVKRPKGGGEETIYRNQYFFRKQYGGIDLYTIDSAGEQIYIRHNNHNCIYCYLGFSDAIRLFKKTDKTRTKYTDWQKCDLGYCRSLSFQIGSRKYWAKYNPVIRRFDVFNIHKGRKSIGTLPIYMIPKEFHKEFVTTSQ
jgi:hypothetical protein